MRDRDLDFTIARLGECRFRRRCPALASPATMSASSITRARGPESLARPGRRSSGDGVGGPAGEAVLRPVAARLRDRDLRRALPGLNDVIRAIVLSLHHHYGVDKVYGFRFGYEGLVRRYGHEPLELTPDAVKRIHEIGRIDPGLLPRAPGPGGDGRRPWRT